MRIAIFWGSLTGSTEEAAESLQEQLGGLVEKVVDVGSIPISELQDYDVLILGVSTWDIGELQYDWEDKIRELDQIDWSGKTVAFFGTGDGIGYDDTFCDAFGILWESIEPQGARLIGTWPVDGYHFRDSRSLCKDRSKFLGLPLDNDNEPELTDERIAKWAEQLKRELDELFQTASSA